MNQIPHELMYIIEVKTPDQSPRKLVVHESLLAGLDPRNDLVLVDKLIAAKHFHFKISAGLLSLHFMGDSNTTYLNGLPLEHDKNYLLDVGDALRCGRIQIHIRRELDQKRSVSDQKKTEQKEFSNDVQLNAVLEEKNLQEIASSLDKAQEKEQRQKPLLPKRQVEKKTQASLKKIGLKIYGFIFDVAFTYFVLTFLIPASGVLDQVQSILYPLTEFFNKTLLLRYPELSHYKILSLFEFFIAFHIIMITSALILANSPGAFLVGLVPEKGNRLGNRFKAYLYTLVNVVTLPLLVLDIPLFRGQSIKESVTFFHRDIRLSPGRTIFRTAIAPSLIVLFFFSPLFLKFPFATVVVEENLITPKYKDVHVRLISSMSSHFGTELKYELNANYSLLPSFYPGKTGFLLFDHSTGKSLIVSEEWRMKTEAALFKLRYGNPLSSLYLPNEELKSESLKNRAFSGLMISPLQFVRGFFLFGPFLGNGVLFKSQFLRPFSRADSFTALAFNDKNPFLMVSSISETMLFWFTPKDIIAYRITAPKQTKLLDHFTRDLINGMKFTQGSADKLKNPGILETLEAFEMGFSQTILTYYIYEAKNLEKKDPAWRSFLKRNILQTKQALIGITNKNIEKSFEDIIKTIP